MGLNTSCRARQDANASSSCRAPQTPLNRRSRRQPLRRPAALGILDSPATKKTTPPSIFRSHTIHILGCSITKMTINRDESPDPQHTTNRKLAIIIAAICSVEAFLLLMLFKWMFHRSATVYLLMIPVALLASAVVARPNWFIRWAQSMREKNEQDMERLEKWTPPGFP